MALEPGTRLGPYEVLAPLGAGGMGEVYRARDSKLGREVAVKVLPDAFAEHPEKLARFEREARLLAGLNHTGIATLYGVEQLDGRLVLVMELVEGETLAERISRGPITVDEALPIALQIAEALEAAHEKGVIHRDLKPANIKIDPDGHVKVLDFGLAKAFAQEELEGDLSQSPTLSHASTQAGVILGTAAYMSPEQAKGKPVDKRSDIFSFGVVLFEMLTGQKAFAGEDASDVLAAIIRGEPSWSVLPSGLDPRLRHLLERCLRKDRRARLRDIGDVRNDLQEIASRPAAGPLVAQAGAPAWRGFLIGIVGTALVTSFLTWYSMRPTEPRVTSFSIDARLVPVRTVSSPTVSISPDGARVAYVGIGAGGMSKLFVRAMGQLDAVPLDGASGYNPFFSPDGQWIGYGTWPDGISKTPIGGGPAVAVAKATGWIAGASWGMDDRIIFGTVGNNGLFRVSASGGEDPEPLTTLGEGETGHRWPEVLPDARAVLFTVEKGPGHFEIEALDLETLTRKPLLPSGSSPRYAATGHVLFGLEGDLHAVPFDADSVRVTGAPVGVISDVLSYVRGDTHFAIGKDGTLVYVRGRNAGERLALFRVDRGGREEALTVEPRGFQEFTLSPDGNRIAARVSDEGNEDVWIQDLTRGTQTRLTSDVGQEVWPVWTPDGQRVAYGTSEGIFWRAADGTGEVEQLLERPIDAVGNYPSGSNQRPQAFSPDGAALVFEDATAGFDIAVLTVDGEHSKTSLSSPSFPGRNATLSPDGRWVAYESNESGQTQVIVRPFPDVDAGRWPVSSEGGTWPLWGPDGRELFYVGPRAMMRVPIGAEPTFSLGRGEALFDKEGYWLPPIAPSNRRLAISRDGQGFLILKEADDSEDGARPRIIVVQNWHQELERLVPVN